MYNCRHQERWWHFTLARWCNRGTRWLRDVLATYFYLQLYCDPFAGERMSDNKFPSCGGTHTPGFGFETSHSTRLTRISFNSWLFTISPAKYPLQSVYIRPPARKKKDFVESIVNYGQLRAVRTYSLCLANVRCAQSSLDLRHLFYIVQRSFLILFLWRC